MPVATRPESPSNPNTLAVPSKLKPRRKIPANQQVHLQGTNGSKMAQHFQSRDIYPVSSDDAMSIEDSPSQAHAPSPQLEHPLEKIVEKVSAQVEAFAEQLDACLEEMKTHPTHDRPSIGSQLVKDYAAITSRHVDEVREKHSHEERTQQRRDWTRKVLRLTSQIDVEDHEQRPIGPVSSGDVQLWQDEANTWNLLEDLSIFRESDVNQEDSRPDPSNDRFAADGECWRQYLSSNSRARERFVVLKWLESTAEQTGHDLEDIQEELETHSAYGQGLWSQGWMDTREKVKGEKRLRLWDTGLGDSRLPSIQKSTKTGLLVAHLDPDAVTRLNKALEEPDIEYERSFWMMCWEMLRRGCSMDALREWCVERNESPKSYMLGATPEDAPQTLLANSIAGRYRWRKACRHGARKGGVSDHERAVLGLLSGDLRSVERVCVSWEDHLFAYCNSLLLNQYRIFVHGRYTASLPPDDLFKFGEVDHFEFGTNENDELPFLKPNELTELDAHSPFKVIQAKAIAYELKELIVEQGTLLARNVSREEPGDLGSLLPPDVTLSPPMEGVYSLTDNQNALRTLAHVYIIHLYLDEDFGSEENQKAAENILIAYVYYLKDAGKFNLIPRYTSFLGPPRVNSIQARVLPAITDDSLREAQLNLMRIVRLPTSEILTEYCTFMLDSSRTLSNGVRNFAGPKLLEDPSDVDPSKLNLWPNKRICKRGPRGHAGEEEDIIHGLQWFMICKRRYAETCSSITKVMRCFLLAGRLNAALELFERHPVKLISMKKTQEMFSVAFDIIDDPEDHIEALIGDNCDFEDGKGPNNIRQLLRRAILHYHEMGQLVEAIDTLWTFRTLEQRRLNIEKLAPHAVSDLTKDLANILQHLQDVILPMLRPGFLFKAVPQSQNDELGNDANTMEALSVTNLHKEAAELTAIRRLYLPEIVLAYMSALHFAGCLVSRDRLLDLLDLTRLVSDNETLTDCFVKTGRMRELVDVVALSSKTLMRLNAEKGRGKKSNKDARNWRIWDVDV